MGNIDKKRREELGENAMHMVGVVDRGLDGGGFPIHVHKTDASVEEICEAMKYIIDTGWVGHDFYARKALCNIDGIIVPIVLFSGSEQELVALGRTRWYEFLDESPLIEGVSSDRSEDGYDGDVYIKLDDNSLVSLEEWKKLQK